MPITDGYHTNFGNPDDDQEPEEVDGEEFDEEERAFAEAADATPGNWWTLDEDDPGFDDEVNYG